MNVYDFDNTIYDGETLVDMVLYFMRHDPKVWPYLPKLAYVWCKDIFHLYTVEEAAKGYSSFLEGYFIKAKDFEKNIGAFWDTHQNRIKPFYKELQKENDIVVSGTMDFILEEIMKRLEIRNYVGSSIDAETGKFKRLCIMENKVTAFREFWPDAHIDNFYTDSMNDKAMMDISDHVFLVKKNKITQIK